MHNAEMAHVPLSPVRFPIEPKRLSLHMYSSLTHRSQWLPLMCGSVPGPRKGNKPVTVGTNWPDIEMA